MLSQKPSIISLSLLLAIILTLQFANQLSAQIFNLDYLTYKDNVAETDTAVAFKWKTTQFIFFGEKEYDESGNASGNNIFSYMEIYLYAAFAVYNNKRIQLSLAPQIGLFLSEKSPTTSWGTPWLVAKYRISKKQPICLRIGFQWGKLGKSFWLEDNKLDLAVLARFKFKHNVLTSSLSYRINTKSGQSLLDFAGLFNQRGNDLHYQLGLSQRLSKRSILSGFVIGYFSSDKKLNGVILPDSHSRKFSVGMTFNYKISQKRNMSFSVLFDVAGRYDKKGFALVFNVTDR